jgi:very-short-patch-repair endonuclease
MKTREQIIEEVSELGSRDLYTYQCEYCHKECTRIVKNIRKGLHKAEGFYCSITCRGKPSWMESSFSEWLDSYNVSYKTEVQFKNHDLGKFYYADFVFDSISLIIELDGNHHRFTVEKDQIRDAYLKSYYNFDVYRVTHKEYRSKVKLPEIKELLGIKE